MFLPRYNARYRRLARVGRNEMQQVKKCDCKTYFTGSIKVNSHCIAENEDINGGGRELISMAGCFYKEREL